LNRQQAQLGNRNLIHGTFLQLLRGELPAVLGF